MRKSLKKLSLLFITTFAFVLFYSCNEKEEVCETCVSSFSDVKINFYSNEFDFKKKTNFDKGYTVMFTGIKNKNQMDGFYQDIKEVFNINIVSSEVVSTTIFTDVELTDKVSNLNFNTIKGFMSYFKTKENYLYLRIFKIENGKISEHKLSNSFTNTISLNNEYDISILLFKSKMKTFITFCDGNDLSIKKNINSNLDENLENEFLNAGLEKKPAVCDSCEARDTNGDCLVESDGQGGVTNACDEAACSSEEVERKLKNNNVLSYDYIQLNLDLHKFKDDYLSIHSGGDNIINAYYDLSKTFKIDDLSIDFCIETFDLITTEIVPMTNSLLDNPYSSGVLINNSSKTKILNYLNEIKEIYTDIESKNKIQNLIDKVNHFSNKSNNFITSNLNDF